MKPELSPPHILIVDDNPNDAELLEAGFSLIDVPVRLDFAQDGIHAQRVLRDMAEAKSCPDLVLLDLNMPRANGFEVLSFIRSHEYCRKSPVVVMTTSSMPQDRDRCLELGAKAFVTKPPTLDELLVVLKQLEPYLHQAC